MVYLEDESRAKRFPRATTMSTTQPQTPQSIAGRSAARLLALVVAAFSATRRVVGSTLRRLVRPLGVYLAGQWVRSLSLDELRELVLQARWGGTLDARDSAMLTSVLEFHDKRAHDVMRPRTDIVALQVDSTEAEVLAVMIAERYSRYPVYRESLDDILGVFLAKDLLLHEGSTPFSLEQYTREAVYVPATRRAELVLDDLRRTRAHMAIVLDEYGGTAGVITMEDLVEQVIGEIADEYDPTTRTSLEADGVLELAGTLSLIDVRADYQLDIPEGEWTTLGGFAFAMLGRAPRVADRVSFPGGELEIVAIDGRRVAALRVHRARSARAPRPPATVPA
jgi:CBS domain containing-hemolysin-like protein